MKLAWVLVSFALGGPALAQTGAADMDADTRLELQSRLVQHMALNPRLVKAVRRQNAAEIGAAEIERLDREWRRSDSSAALKWALQENEPGRFLQQQIEAGAVVAEAYLTDRRGVNVAAFPAPQEYFHGADEDWQYAFNDGQGRTWVGDDAAGDLRRIAVPVIDRGRTIGVLVVALRPDALTADAAAAGQ